MTEAGNPAFAHGSQERGGDPGISKRDYFAAAALSSVMVQCADDLNKKSMFGERIEQTLEEYFAERAYAVADAMLRAGGHVDD